MKRSLTLPRVQGDHIIIKLWLATAEIVTTCLCPIHWWMIYCFSVFAFIWGMRFAAVARFQIAGAVSNYQIEGNY